MEKLSKKSIFWILFIIASLSCSLFTIKYFSTAFPIVHLDITINRNDALEQAKQLAQKHNLGPANFWQTASFETDTLVKTYVELEAGGTDAFNTMIAGSRYMPYTWSIRHFKPLEINETRIQLKPDGTPYGFIEKIAEQTPGPHLDSKEAQHIAEQEATINWNIELENYKLIETSQEVKPNGRADHTFVYEQPIDLEKAHYRLRLTVSGNRVTEVKHFIHIPEEFLHRYQEMRSANNTLATAASFMFILLYIIGGTLIGLFLLLRQQFVVWYQPLLWAFFLSFLQFFTSINQLPILWMHYNTTSPVQGFLLSYVLKLGTQFFLFGAFYMLIIMAAESLTRKAFGSQLQLWKLWLPRIASSYNILGRTIGGYLLVPILLAFVVTFYIFTSKYINWWLPSEELFNPNILATYFPWISSLTNSLIAGFTEECLFRAIPLASAALIGTRFGGRTKWIASAFIIQALIFGAAHANYPAQPAYARLVELIIPSFIFGGIYLLFGLLPSIIAHFTYDVFWLSVPLFISHASTAWINQLFIVICTLIPLFIVLYARIKTGSWNPLEKNVFNKDWRPPEKKQIIYKSKEQFVYSLRSTIARGMFCVGILGLIAWTFFTNFQPDSPPLTISRHNVKNYAHQTLNQQGVKLTPEWSILACVFSHFNDNINIQHQHRFIWQKGGKKLYHQLLETYLKPPSWIVRFVKFDGTTLERAEEFKLLISENGNLLQTTHILPEEQPGKTLSEQKAREIAHQELRTYFKLDPLTLQEINAQEQKQPQRKDWTFIFSDKSQYHLAEGEPRIIIEIKGDEVTNKTQYIHVPEQWIRDKLTEKDIIALISMFCGILFFALILYGLFILFKQSKHSFNLYLFLRLSGIFSLILTGATINKLPKLIALFNTQTPFMHQLFVTIGFLVVSIIFSSGFYGLIIILIKNYRPQFTVQKSCTNALIGFNLGLAVAGLNAIINKYKPSIEPLWATYEPLNSFFPFFETLTSYVTYYFSITFFFLILFTIIDYNTKGFRSQKIRYSLLLLSYGLIFTGIYVIPTIPYWIIHGTLFGIILLISYYFIIRYDFALIPLTTAAFISTQAAQQAFFNCYPTVQFAIIVTIIIINSIAIYCFRKMR